MFKGRRDGSGDRSRVALGVAAVVAYGASATASATLIDAFGDAQDVMGAGPPLLDIDTMCLVYDGSSLHFEVTFHTPVSAPSSGQPDGVVGHLAFDTDQDPATGIAPPQNKFSPPFASLVIGADYGIDLFSELLHPGFVDVLDASLGVVDTVPISYGPMSIAGSIPLASLGGDDGVIDFTVGIGPVTQPTDATDVVGTSVPVPCPWDCGNGDGIVDTVDFLALLAEWGPNPGSPCDFNRDDQVDTVDFLDLLANWGSCP